MSEDRTKHLEFVQAIIGRMAGNSFLLKGWTVTLNAALLALAASQSNSLFLLVALLPSLAFWGLDAFYLKQERLFRKLYDDLRSASEETLREIQPFSMATTKYEGSVPGWFRTLWSPTIITLHGIVIGTILIAIVSRRFIH